MKKLRSKTIRWVVTIFLVTVVISGTISLISDEVMSSSGIISAFLILFAIILLGIVFDIIGMAVALIVGIAAIKTVKLLVKNDKFTKFAWYLIPLGLIITGIGIFEKITGTAITI